MTYCEHKEFGAVKVDPSAADTGQDEEAWSCSGLIETRNYLVPFGGILRPVDDHAFHTVQGQCLRTNENLSIEPNCVYQTRYIPT